MIILRFILYILSFFSEKTILIFDIDKKAMDILDKFLDSNAGKSLKISSHTIKIENFKVITQMTNNYQI